MARVDVVGGGGHDMAMTRPRSPGHWEPRHAGDEPHLLREIMRVQQAVLAVFSHEVGAPSSRLVLLRTLASAGPDGIGVTSLARRMGVDVAGVSRQVSELEADRLVERLRDGADARRIPVRLTPKGLRAFEAVHERAHDLERSLAALVGPEDLATAVRVLGEVRRALEARR